MVCAYAWCMTHSQHQHGQHTHEHGGTPTHGHAPVHGHSHDHSDDERMAEMLDMDAALQADHLAEITNWVAGLAGAPESIVDLGSGTGTGTLALAERFERATVFAVDNSEQMLGYLGAKAEARGLDGRVVKVHADLDARWPSVGAADLVWAASSIHHVADPDKVFGDVFAALNPGGLFAVVEMDSFPRFLPDDIGWGEPGLEARCHRLIDAQGWNAHPDWQSQLEAAGFEVQQRNFAYELAPEPTAMAPYAQLWLGRTRAGLEDKLSPPTLPRSTHCWTRKTRWASNTAPTWCFAAAAPFGPPAAPSERAGGGGTLRRYRPKTTSLVLVTAAVRCGALWNCQYRFMCAMTASGAGAPHGLRSPAVWASPTSVTS